MDESLRCGLAGSLYKLLTFLSDFGGRGNGTMGWVGEKASDSQPLFPGISDEVCQFFWRNAEPSPERPNLDLNINRINPRSRG
jgi:hypothetical protein